MVREMTPADAAAVWELFVRSLGYDAELAVVRQCIERLAGDERHATLVWEDESGEVCGFLHAMRYDTLHNLGGWDVVSLAVMPEAQGRGIGRALLAAFEEQVVREGGSFVRLNSRVERTAAHGFYEHLGYTCDKTQKRFIKRLH